MRAPLSLGIVCLLFSFSACDKKDDTKAKPGDNKSSAAESKDAKGAKDGGGAIGAFTEYKRKSMASEALVNLHSIALAARLAYEEETVDPANPMAPAARKLPPSAPMTPEAGACCKQDGGTCPTTFGKWDHEGWKAMSFQPSSPHRYSYAFEADDKGFVVKAVGDLDCDGVLATYTLAGKIGPDGELTVDEKPTKENELE